jgi:copper chaperone NosL
MTSFRWLPTVALAAVLAVALPACSPDATDGPPEVRYGESVCAECGMILSDERYATATIVDGERGPEVRLFDDFNCQIAFEADDPAPRVTRRWVHDQESREWLLAPSAYYVRAEKLRTPMASGVAAFATDEAASRVAGELDGEVLTFDDLWAN